MHKVWLITVIHSDILTTLLITDTFVSMEECMYKNQRTANWISIGQFISLAYYKIWFASYQLCHQLCQKLL